MREKVIEFLKSRGAEQAGVCRAAENPFGMDYAISYTVRLSDAIVDGIDNAPTHTYFHHYRTVNAFIDRLSLECGFMLARHGFKYVPVPASQSVNGMQGIYSHKRAAVDAGLGTIGKSCLFLSSTSGPRVRLGTILTDCKFEVLPAEPKNLCGDCRLCVTACPAMAITGAAWSPDTPRSEMLDAKACSDHMKSAFKHIGRGAVCGICMRACPLGTDKNNN